MALESFGSTPGTNPFGSNTTTTVPSTKKFDWKEWAPILGRIAGILVAGLVGGKDYGGIAAGSAAGTLNQLAQLEEEQKQRELERQIREWEFNLQKQVAEQEEKRRKALETYWGAVEKDLGSLAQPVSPMTYVGEAEPTTELALRGKFGEPYDAWTLAASAPLEIRQTPGIEGDRFARQLVGQAQAAGGLAYLPETIQSKALEYLWGQTLPKEPEPYVSGEPYIEFQLGLHPSNPYRKLAPNEFADPNVRKEAANFDETLRKLYPEEAPAPPKRKRESFEVFSKDNKSAAYALANYDSLSNEKLDDLYMSAIDEEFKLRAEKTKTEKGGGEGGAGMPGKWDPSKIYRGSPKVQLWLKLYDQYVESQGGVKLSDIIASAGQVDTETLKQLMNNFILGNTQSPKAKTLEQWLRGQPGGAKIWSQIVSEFDLFGDPFYKTPAGQFVVEKGSIASAIYDVIGRDDTPANRKLLQDLIKRYNEQYNVTHDEKWWYQQGIAEGKIKKKK